MPGVFGLVSLTPLPVTVETSVLSHSHSGVWQKISKCNEKSYCTHCVGKIIIVMIIIIIILRGLVGGAS
jgi:hypothetical protein